MNLRDDATLLARLRAGDAHAYELVFRAHHGRLCGFAYGYLRNPADAEEVVQDVFLALWQRRERLEIQSSLRAYLFAAVRNRVLNRSARARLEQRWLEESDDAYDTVADPAEPIDQAVQLADITERVQAALAGLSPGCRRVLELRWLEQLSYAEIGEALGISVKGVENQLSRARKVLREKLPGLTD